MTTAPPRRIGTWNASAVETLGDFDKTEDIDAEGDDYELNR